MPGLQDALEALSKLASDLAVRRGKGDDLEEYLEYAGSFYDVYGYLPIVYPIHARNFTYYKILSKAPDDARTLVELASEHLDAELNPLNPMNVAAAIVYWSLRLCVERTRPGSALGEASFRIGTLKVGLNAYCDAMARIPLVTLVLASNYYYSYALNFYLEALSEFASKSATFKECRYKGPFRDPDDVALVSRECPESYEGFRRELTSRVGTGLRALLASLYLIKWIYDPLEVLGLLEPRLIRGGGLRSNYPVQPTYLGRLLSEALEVWMHSLVDDRALRAFGLAVLEYFRLVENFLEEPRRLEGSVRKWENLYVSEPIREWVNALKVIIEESEALKAVNPLRLGEAVEDLVSVAINERAHALIAGYTSRPQLASLYTKLSNVDMRDLVFNRILRIK